MAWDMRPSTYFWNTCDYPTKKAEPASVMNQILVDGNDGSFWRDGMTLWTLFSIKKQEKLADFLLWL